MNTMWLYELSTCHTHFLFFFFNDTATTEIYTLSLHDALPICLLLLRDGPAAASRRPAPARRRRHLERRDRPRRSEEHTSELQSQSNLVCRLLLEKKKRLPAAIARPCRLPIPAAPTCSWSTYCR